MGNNCKGVFYETYYMFAEQIFYYFMKECGDDEKLAKQLSVDLWVDFAGRHRRAAGEDTEKVCGWLQIVAWQLSEPHRKQ